jgi:glycosyltransferase involved in cell wall biosynthesis
MALSFVIPFMNEKDTLVELFDRIAASVRPLLRAGEEFEVIFVDDGSTDGSTQVAVELCKQHPECSLIELRGNFGKSAALAAGFDRARGDIVFTLDADLQDDPKEIPRFLAELDKGLDVVSGYKQKRHDPIHKVFPSRVFNAMVRSLTGTKLRDVNCGFKAYRADVVKNVRLYGELHRFVPVLAHLKRFKVGEIVVEHHPRRFGVSKFGARRFFRGFVDLLTVTFLLRYDRKPAHFFGIFGGLLSMLGLGICGYLSVLWFLGEAIGHRPLLTLGVLLIGVGLQVLLTGLLAELLVHQGGGSAPYLVRRIVSERDATEGKLLRALPDVVRGPRVERPSMTERDTASITARASERVSS